MCYRNCFRGLLLLLASCFLSFFTSCQSGQDEVPAPEGQCTVTFSVTNYKQISFDDLSGTGSTRATEKVSMTLANMSLTVFDAETNKIVCPTILHESKNYDESNAKTFPLFSVTLPYGHYRVLVLGYNGKHDCSIASLNHISWEGDYVPNTFLYCDGFTLNKDSNLKKEITLKHVVAAFRMTTEDAVPAELKKMHIVCTAGGTMLDATTGFTPQSTGRTSEINVPDNHIGIKDTFTVYLFLPEEQINTNYTVQALDKNNDVLYEKHFSNVPLRINYLTEWKGKLFETSDDGGDDKQDDVQSSFDIKWDMNWADTLKFQP